MLAFREHFTQQETEEKFFSGASGTYTKIDHILCHNASLNKLKRFKLHKECSLPTMELNYKSITERYVEKSPNIWKLHNGLDDLSNSVILSYPHVSLSPRFRTSQMKIQKKSSHSPFSYSWKELMKGDHMDMTKFW